MILLNPGPVCTSERVRNALMKGDMCHRESEFSTLLSSTRKKILQAFAPNGDYTTEFGRKLDIIVDAIVNAVIVIGITIAVYTKTGSILVIIAGFFAMTGITISLLLVTYFSHNSKKNTGAKEMLDKLNNKGFFYIIMLLSVIFNQMIWFLLIMAIGTNIYWIVHKIAYR